MRFHDKTLFFTVSVGFVLFLLILSLMAWVDGYFKELFNYTYKIFPSVLYRDILKFLLSLLALLSLGLGLLVNGKGFNRRIFLPFAIFGLLTAFFHYAYFSPLGINGLPFIHMLINIDRVTWGGIIVGIGILTAVE